MSSAQLTKKEEARRCTEVMRELILGFRARFEEEFRQVGITLPQLRMLKTIAEQHEVSAATIARMCHVTPQTLHAMLTRAEREGWIVRGTSDRNHRFVTAALTPRGEAIVQSGLELRERMEAEVWRGVPLEALQGVREMLERGLANLARSETEPATTARHPKP